MGSQYHHYIFGIILQKEENWNWIYHNYMGMVVKHFYHSHGDFMHDGIYSGCDRLIKKYRVQGPVKDLQQIIQSSIRNGVYVILNINEQNLSHRQAYKKYYFRHDLLIYGYNEKTNQCLTAGFNENMEFCEIEYPYAEIEEAYRSMPNEWDYELFLLKWNEEYVERIDWSYIQRELRAYIEGKNPTRQLVDEFLENVTSIEFVGESYKEYYGIQLYDYLEDRIKGQNKLFRRNRSNETIGANDGKNESIIIYTPGGSPVYGTKCGIYTAIKEETVASFLGTYSAYKKKSSEESVVVCAERGNTGYNCFNYAWLKGYPSYDNLWKKCIINSDKNFREDSTYNTYGYPPKSGVVGSNGAHAVVV